MKSIVIFLGLFIGALSVIPVRRPTPVPTPSTTNPPVKYRYYCSRYRNQRCTRNSAPACGWYDQKKVRCHTFPCAVNYANPCVACNNLNVKYVTCETCPHPNTPLTMINYADSNTGRFPTCINHH